MLQRRSKRRTLSDLNNLYERIYERVEYGSGYQPFGYDMPTLQITHPICARAFKRLHLAVAELERKSIAAQLAGLCCFL